MPAPKKDKPVAETPAPTTPSLKRFGHLPDPPDPRDLSLGMLFGAVNDRALPAEIVLRPYVLEVYDQDQTNSCVANATIAAIELRYRLRGAMPPRLARRGAYVLARALARGDTATPLTDDGCYPRMMFKAGKNVGFPLESFAPFSVDKIDEELDWKTLQDASAHRITGWYRSDVYGAARIGQIRQALANNYPVVFGAAVGPSFMDAGPHTVVMPEEPEKVRGGHMVTIVGYRTSNSGRVEFLILNSYGTGYADGGFVWVDESFVTDPRSSDFYVITT